MKAIVESFERSSRNDEKCQVSIKETVEAILELDFGEGTCGINRYIQKRTQNNDMFTVIYSAFIKSLRSRLFEIFEIVLVMNNVYL